MSVFFLEAWRSTAGIRTKVHALKRRLALRDEEQKVELARYLHVISNVEKLGKQTLHVHVTTTATHMSCIW